MWLRLIQLPTDFSETEISDMFTVLSPHKVNVYYDWNFGCHTILCSFFLDSVWMHQTIKLKRIAVILVWHLWKKNSSGAISQSLADHRGLNPDRSHKNIWSNYLYKTIMPCSTTLGDRTLRKFWKKFLYNKWIQWNVIDTTLFNTFLSIVLFFSFLADAP